MSSAGGEPSVSAPAPRCSGPPIHDSCHRYFVYIDIDFAFSTGWKTLSSRLVDDGFCLLKPWVYLEEEQTGDSWEPPSSLTIHFAITSLEGLPELLDV